MAGIAGTEGLLIDIDTGTVRRDHVLVQHTPGALVFLGFGPRAERLRRFAFDDQGDAPFIARCRDVARAAETGRLVKARQAGISYAVLDIEDRVLRRFLIAESLAKAGYDPDEPRDDHGRWTGGGGGASAEAASAAAEKPTAGGASASAAGARPVAGVAAGSTAVVGSAVRGLEGLAGRAAALFDSLAPASALSSLAAIGARLSAPAAFLSIILIPNNSNLAEDGTLPDQSGVSYHFDRDTGTLTLTQGGETFYSGHPDQDGIFLDQDGHPIGRELDGSLVLNSKAIAARAPRSAARARASAKADTDRDEPETCPDPSKDRRPDKKKDPAEEMDRASAYQAQISELVNPGRSLKTRTGQDGMAVRLPRAGLDHPPDPTNINDWVYFDECRLADGTMIEAKGPGYLDMLNKGRETYPWLGVREKLLKQADSQLKAARGRQVVWYFAEPEIADYAKDLFFKNGIPFEVLPYTVHTANILIIAMSNFGLIYDIMAYWGPRADTPEALAPRFLRTLDELSAIDPAFSHWLIGHERGIDLAPLSLAEVVKYIADGGEEGVPVLRLLFPRHQPDQATVALFHARFQSGLYQPGEASDQPYFHRTLSLCEENSSLITLAVLKPALLVLASLWQPMWCNIGPWGLNDYRFRPDPPRPWFGPAWVTYLSPRFAPLVTPPPSVIAEPLPDGALLMIATEDQFHVDNPDHLAAALDIQSALAPINALPWPPDAEPES